MIIETTYKANDTITIRTTAGEELVARFVSEDANHLVVTKPLALQVSQQGIGLGPWTFTVDPASTIKLCTVLYLSIKQKKIWPVSICQQQQD